VYGTDRNVSEPAEVPDGYLAVGVEGVEAPSQVISDGLRAGVMTRLSQLLGLWSRARSVGLRRSRMTASTI
jgi:hypothetical protein